jgi:hypothetical protein
MIYTNDVANRFYWLNSNNIIIREENDNQRSNSRDIYKNL